MTTARKTRRPGRARRRLNWALIGAAFVTVLATAAGCSARHAPASSLRADASQADGSSHPGEAQAMLWPSSDALLGAPPPKINVFGEFDGVQRSATTRFSEAGFQQHTYLDDGCDIDVALDPGGKWLVFSSTRHSEHSDIYMQKVDGLSVTQLTSDEADDAFPVFSPDCSKIAFCSTRAGNWDIYLMDADGKNPVQITSSPMHEIHPSFSPDGQRLVYCAMSSRSGQWELWTVNLNDGQKRMIGYGLFPVWSPNRQKDQIAFQKARARGSRWFSLWTLDLVDGEARRVTEVAVSSNAAIVWPSWSPDGTKLSFVTIVEPGRYSDGRPRTQQQDIWTINVDGTSRRRITDGAALYATPFWGSDNRIYFVSDRGGTECIWSARADQTPGTATVRTDTQQVEP